MPASHGYKSITMDVVLKGDGIEQRMTLSGARLDEHEDMMKYVDALVRPKLEALAAPAEAKGLRAQVTTLEKSVADLLKENADLKAAKGAVIRGKKEAAKAHQHDNDGDL